MCTRLIRAASGIRDREPMADFGLSFLEESGSDGLFCSVRVRHNK
jgi:hypothetical protein